METWALEMTELYWLKTELLAESGLPRSWLFIMEVSIKLTIFKVPVKVNLIEVVAIENV